MAPMGIRLSPLGVAVFCLLGLGVLYHLYSGFLAGRFAFLMLGGPAAEPGSVDLRELLAASVAAAVKGGEEVKLVREGNNLNEKAKGKTREGADEMLTFGDLHSNRKMYHLLKAAFPGVQVGLSLGGCPVPALRWAQVQLSCLARKSPCKEASGQLLSSQGCCHEGPGSAISSLEGCSVGKGFQTGRGVRRVMDAVCL